MDKQRSTKHYIEKKTKKNVTIIYGSLSSKLVLTIHERNTCQLNLTMNINIILKLIVLTFVSRVRVIFTHF